VNAKGKSEALIQTPPRALGRGLISGFSLKSIVDA